MTIYHVRHEPGTAWLDYPWVVKIGSNTIRSRHGSQSEAEDEAIERARGADDEVWIHNKMGKVKRKIKTKGRGARPRDPESMFPASFLDRASAMDPERGGGFRALEDDL